jgi:hypothetical protein
MKSCMETDINCQNVLVFKLPKIIMDKHHLKAKYLINKIN